MKTWILLALIALRACVMVDPVAIASPRLTADQQLADQVAEFYADPLGFVQFAYPWGEPGTPLADCDGPDEWQSAFLLELGAAVQDRGFDGLRAVDPIREVVASGHGIGKSTLVAWVVDWIMSTRPDAQGTITANTVTQLKTKTWPAIQKWTKLCITSHWFRLTSEAMRRVGHEETWFCTAQTAKPENSEAFAGQHAATSTSFYIFDEASAVPDQIWEVAEGGLTDGEPMIFGFGNPTRSSGAFHRACFGADRETWRHRSIDSRTSRFTNKSVIQQWITKYGEDSDFVRVRVLGLAPKASDLQYIDSQRVEDAQRREAHYYPDDPLIVGLDVARGGNASSVFRFRRGLDARSIPAIRIPGEECRDSMRLVSLAAQILTTPRGGVLPAALFVDSGFGGPVVDRLRQLGHTNVHEITFGGKAPDSRHFANMRSYMWSKMRDFLTRGAIGKETELESDLTGPGYHHNDRDQLVLESKDDMLDRGLASPDDGDALALTFAQAVAPIKDEDRRSSSPNPRPRTDHGWMA